MRNFITILLCYLSSFCFGQEIINKDTTISFPVFGYNPPLKVTYHYAIFYDNGKIKALGEKKIEKGSNWIYFDEKGKATAWGVYNKRGKKDGYWAEPSYLHGFIIYKNGKEIGRTFECPPF